MPSTLSAPSTDMDGTYTISWSSVTGATRYELQESTLSGSTWGSYTTIYNASGTSTSRTRPDGNYRYQVRACKTTACSAWQGPVYTEVGTGVGGCSMNTSDGEQLLSAPTESTGTEDTSTDGTQALAGPGC